MPRQPHYSNNPHHNNIADYGCSPFVVDIKKSAVQNDTFRTALWTGHHLQLTLMSIPAGEDIGLEMHPNVDQFLHIAEGRGLVQMGDRKDNLTFRQSAFNDCAIFIPAGTWHNLINTGSRPIKLYSVYAPPNHAWGTVHQTKAIAEAAETYYH
jgi:mannose-6-phosphate isomerase-like protein (cupin superfamily)